MRFINRPSYDVTYSDVFMIPSKSDVDSRFDVDLTAEDGTGTTIPLVAANMTTVTGKRMAETMARRGGLAVLPQDTPLNIIREVTAYLKARSPLFDTPIILEPHNTVIEAYHLMDKRPHNAALIADNTATGEGYRGIVLAKDCENVDRFTPLSEVMRADTPTFDALEFKDAAREGVFGLPGGLKRKFRHVYETLDNSHADFAAVLDGSKAVGALNRKNALRSTIYQPALDGDGKLLVAAAIGINGEVQEKAQDLIRAGVDVLVVDTAHGHQNKMLEAVKAVKELGGSVPIVAGNVVTAEGVSDLREAGADIIKVGVGPGAMCTTRMMTAVGRPQLSAVLECAAEAHKLGAHVWADGGVRHPRDVALALAAGASQVMIGSWFAGTYESPGDLLHDSDGRRYKESFGMASAKAVQNRAQAEKAFERARKALFEEGISTSRMYIDPASAGVEDLLDCITSGVRSSMAYAGATTLAQFRQRAVIGLQSVTGYEEGRPLAQSW